MNRTTVFAIALAVSIFLNLALFVMIRIERGRSEEMQLAASKVEENAKKSEQQAKAYLDTCEGLKAQAEQAREDCERKILAISNRK
jgi:hypothetical protein